MVRLLSQGGERGLVGHVESRSAVVAVGCTATSTATTTTGATLAATIATTATTATRRTLETSINLDVDLLLLLSLGLRSRGLGLQWSRSRRGLVEDRKSAYLANKVSVLIFILLGNDDRILEVRVVDLAGLELGNNVKGLLLLQVLVESESVVLLLGLAGLAALSLLGRCRRALSGGLTRSGPGITLARGAGPLVLLGSRIGGGSSLSVQLGDGLITTPTLVNLLLRIAIAAGQ